MEKPGRRATLYISACVLRWWLRPLRRAVGWVVGCLLWG